MFKRFCMIVLSLPILSRFAARVPFVRIVRLKILLLLSVASLGASCPGPTPLPPPRAGAWLVFLCQASDDTSEPHDVAFYNELFANNKPDLVTGFFRTMSGNAVDLSGTEVYGWFRMTVATAALAPAVRNVNTNPGRGQTAQDCKSAGAAALLASNRTIDMARYAGFIAVVNVSVDAGAAGPSVVANNYESASFYQHEMLHVLGLPHSNRMANDMSADHSWETGADKTYEDPWDIMSFRRFIYETPAGNHDITGPELHIAYRQKMGWVPASRVFTKDTADRSRSTVTLAPVSETSRPGMLMARVNVAGGNVSYVVEYRVPTGFDRGLPGSAVVIRELRQNGQTYLVSRQGATLPYQAIANNGFITGERFTDAGNFLAISVDAMTATSATITIDPAFVTTARLGDVCGNKYVGQIRTCPTNSTCDPRRNPPLVSIDYFCQ